MSETRTDAATVAEARRPATGSSPAAILALVVTNAIPLLGVLFWNWCSSRSCCFSRIDVPIRWAHGALTPLLRPEIPIL